MERKLNWRITRHTAIATDGGDRFSILPSRDPYPEGKYIGKYLMGGGSNEMYIRDPKTKGVLWDSIDACINEAEKWHFGVRPYL